MQEALFAAGHLPAPLADVIRQLRAEFRGELAKLSEKIEDLADQLQGARSPGGLGEVHGQGMPLVPPPGFASSQQSVVLGSLFSGEGPGKEPPWAPQGGYDVTSPEELLSDTSEEPPTWRELEVMDLQSCELQGPPPSSPPSPRAGKSVGLWEPIPAAFTAAHPRKAAGEWQGGEDTGSDGIDVDFAIDAAVERMEPVGRVTPVHSATFSKRGSPLGRSLSSISGQGRVRPPLEKSLSLTLLQPQSMVVCGNCNVPVSACTCPYPTFYAV